MDNQSKIIKVLLIEDNPEDVYVIGEMLDEGRSARFVLEYADQPQSGLQRLAQGGIDVVLLGMSQSNILGLDYLVRLHARAPELPIVVLAGLDDGAVAVQALCKGAQDYLVKEQLDSDSLVRSIRCAMERQQTLAEFEQDTHKLQDLLYSIDNIIQKSPDGIVIVDKAGVVLFANLAAEALLGRKTEELIGQMFGFPVVAGEEAELDIVRKNGETAIVEMREVEIVWKGETVYLASLRDITEHKKREEQLKRSFSDLAETVSRAIGARDTYMSGHEQRVAKLARLVGEKTGLDKDRLQGLYVGSLLHDTGTISTPESLLSKSNGLSEEERSIIRAHTIQGYDILKDAKLPWPVADMALHHHERLDGSGYPHGIKGDNLSLEDRILAVCDVVEAMSSPRHHRSAKSKEDILNEIKSGRGTKYDAAVVDVMEQIIENGESEI
jgi:HD-GYP domain-containing protein (c-di-GMP phosphodiesterase class II)/CheY-like chemotaxis protein